MNWATHCARCGADFSEAIHTMSKFNTDQICCQCKQDEELAPGYKAADEAEFNAVLRGNLNFPGVGLSDEDRQFLAKKRSERMPKL